MESHIALYVFFSKKKACKYRRNSKNQKGWKQIFPFPYFFQYSIIHNEHRTRIVTKGEQIRGFVFGDLFLCEEGRRSLWNP